MFKPHEIFDIERDGLTVTVKSKVTQGIVGTMALIPNPRFPHYVVANWDGVVVDTAVSREDADNILIKIMNAYIKEYPQRVRLTE